MTTKTQISCILFTFLFTLGYGQKGKSKLLSATADYERFAYVKTIDVLQKVVDKGYKSVDLFQKLGNSYYFNNKMENAAKWYGELMSLDEKIDAEYYFRYAQSLKSLEKYTESDDWMSKFQKSKTNDLRAKVFTSSEDYLSKIDEASRDFEIYNLNINTELSDFGSTQFNNQLIFSSNRAKGELYEWNEQPYLELYSASLQQNGSYINVKAFGKHINTKYHESSAAFMPDGKTMFFTRNNYYQKRLKRDKKGVNRLQLLRAVLQSDQTWGNVELIHFNNEKHSVAHPTINASGTKLYFSSDMPGSIGQSDIHVVSINDDGSLATPKNLGTIINTEGQETFPFINENGDLYFSSNGHNGLGGLDVYVIKDFENKMANSETFVVENVGRPINSPHDDFGYYENLSDEKGFFTSNRPGGKGDDDIYSFYFPEPCAQIVEGIVIDKKSNEILPNAGVTLYNEEGLILGEVVAGEDAMFTFDLECGKEYIVRAEKENYSVDEKHFNSPNKTEEIKVSLGLEKETEALKPGVNLSDFLVNPIYFDLDKSNIRLDAALELQKVITVLKENPTLKIDVRSHTDSRASFAYNEALSDRRNKSTIKYIVEVGGISADRLTGRGYGEIQLKNKCADDVPCSEEEHQLNRRSDFIVMSTD